MGASAGAVPLSGRTALLRWPADRPVICHAGMLLLLVCLALWVPRLTGPINFRWDASAYYILGTALAEGNGYRLLNEPGEIEAVQYPPLLPMIVAAVQSDNGHDTITSRSGARFGSLISSSPRCFLLMSLRFGAKIFIAGTTH